MELRDISEMQGVDLNSLQLKISAGANMKIAIQRFLDEYGKELAGDKAAFKGSEWSLFRKRVRELKKAYEGWCNLEI